MGETTIEYTAVGARVWFEEERLPYTVQARTERFIVCTKPFAARHTVIYTIIDLEAQARGTDGFVFCGGYETRADCEKSLTNIVENHDGISHRNHVPLRIRKINPPTDAGADHG